MKLTPEKKIGLFKMLATKNLYDVGIEYGFDKYYKTPKALKSAVYRIYADMKNNPEKYAIQSDTYELVIDAVSSRSVSNQYTNKTIAEKKEEEKDIKKLMLSNRDKAAILVSKKLDALSRSKRALDSISLPQLTTSLAILFDKGQILSGQATEHIAHLSKVEDGLTPQQLLETVVKQREYEVERKNN